MMRKLICALLTLAALMIVMQVSTPPARAGCIACGFAVPANFPFPVAPWAFPFNNKLWAGLGYPLTGYVYPYLGYAVVPSFVYQPYPYYFGGLPIYGRAYDLTTFYRYGLVYGYPWVWGFWDPPDHGSTSSIIRYDEVFTGMDPGGNPIGLDGITVTDNQVMDNTTGVFQPTTTVQTDFGHLLDHVDPTNLPNIHHFFDDAIANTPNAPVSVSSLLIPIEGVACQAPEPGTLLFCGIGLMTAGLVRRRRRSCAPTL